MWQRSWWTGLLVAVLIIAGCGKSGQTGPAGSAASDQPAAAATPTEPAPVVAAFLDAIRTGNDDAAMGLLTSTARQKAIEANRNPTPPASDSARYEVGAVEYVGQDGARVACTWSDLDESGKPRTDRALWVLRREPVGWRVAGVAAVIFEGEPPLLLNFEDPEDMAKKQQWLREEVARRAKSETPTADGKQAAQAEKPPQDAFRR
ncbi:MAG: hypothetical protein ABSF26_19520 [Thermoguttaceae bacterium]|jgi:hypothetical protein